jgi:hypothetical protein
MDYLIQVITRPGDNQRARAVGRSPPGSATWKQVLPPGAAS